MDRGSIHRANRRLKNRLPRLISGMTPAWRTSTTGKGAGMDKSLIMALASCRWIAERHNLFISGPTGVGKSFLACVLGHKACLEGATRSPTRECQPSCAQWSRSEGTVVIIKMIVADPKINLFILDDWGLERLSRKQSLGMLEVLENCYGRGFTIVTG
ncbi:hypothetical protein DFAR_220011 [Desulfarculales bacterium]